MNQEKDFPSIVYKYRNWSDQHNKNLLLNNELFLSSPSKFNDPFDCRIPINYQLLDNEAKKNAFIVKTTLRHVNHLLQRKIDVLMTMDDLKQRLQNLNRFQEENDKYLFDSQEQHVGVLSLSERWDSILMWSHYANNHTGYCVGLHEKKLRLCEKFGKGGRVMYHPLNSFPVIDPLRDYDPMEMAFLGTHSKCNEWEYEKEYRLTKLFFPNIPTVEDRKVTISNDYIHEVILGCKISPNAKAEIIKIAKKKKIKIFQAYMVPFKFELNKREILV